MATLQIRRRDDYTPSRLRKKYGLNDRELLTLIDLGDGSFLLTPKASKVMLSANKVTKKVKESGASLDELLAALDEERRRYYKEHYVKH